MLEKIGKLVANPHWAYYRLRSRIGRQKLLDAYAAHARRLGLDRLYLILSFDCDTEEDIAVAWETHSRLLDKGVRVVYAVPGELLRKGESTYRRILESGGEFINHGYTEHTYFDTVRGRYASCFFYDQLSSDVVRNDIVQGDICLKESLGISAQGFRAPHFGTFQSDAQLRFLHAVVGELDYAFSTSTLPYRAFRHGPLFRDFGRWEIPVSGMASDPMAILDSWSCFAAPDRSRTPDDYLTEGVGAAKAMRELGAGLLNFYADPSHIHDQPQFFAAVDFWVSVAESVTYRELLEKLPCTSAS